ncbi:hypothetical protein M5689_021041 [Euphorbia peplus]|nr:hypothetical protein M5689_021041 [Euphorbia peplus]
MSPYLFILCMERLDRMLKDAINLNKIWPIKLCNGGPSISHLFFVDDLFVCLEAEVEQVEIFLKVMEHFCSASGQRLNLHKSKLCVPKNVTDSRARELGQACSIPLTKCLDKYLGVPLMHDRVSTHTFAETVNKVQTKLSSWKSNSLSLAGQITLVSSVTSSTPNHIMQNNLLPANTLEKLYKLIRRFIWGHTEDNHKMRMWDTVCK